jgi:hypothetical protein
MRTSSICSLTLVGVVCLSLATACSGVNQAASGSSVDGLAPTTADDDSVRGATEHAADAPAEAQVDTPQPTRASGDPASLKAPGDASPNTPNDSLEPWALAQVTEAGVVKGPPNVVLTGPAHTGASPPRQLPDPADDASISAGPLRVIGEADPQLREELEKLLRTRLRAAQACHRQAKQRGESPAGTLTLRFALMRGRPNDVTVANDTTGSEALGPCIARTLPALFVRYTTLDPATRFEYSFAFHAEPASDD